MEPFYYTIVGYLKAAYFIANNMKKPAIARDLLNYELIEPGLSSRSKLLAIAKKENINIENVLEKKHKRQNKKIESIYNLKVPTRLKNILIHQGINNIEELSKYTRKQALTFRNAGKKSIDELESYMAQYGIFFKS
ncbi:MAG: DNA-directed RNA polymerase subunit alpha C-terminal domain-containing protein [Bacteroidales bacterium]|jgi:DNA-directed RNA polymerase alpha subunit|nr:DNA-directed RNA polymerase subunit alpha C-terminal domain-containing protein [Bacteroidales bacterium]